MSTDLLCWEVREDGTEDYDSGDWIILSGGDPDSPIWTEFIAGFERSITGHLEVARLWLESRDGGIPRAEDWCNDHYLDFSDGKKLSFTWRGWGDFAQAVVGKREGYLAYSMANPSDTGGD